jgi:hypothetical protein
MTDINRALFNAAMRQSLPTFVRKAFQVLCPGQTLHFGWYMCAICYQLERVIRGEITRLIIEVQPRSGKSLTTSVSLPAFLLGRDPTRRIVCASYSTELAYKHSNDFRSLMSHPFYKEVFPRTRIGRKDTEREIETTARGFRLATSVGGTLTGRGGEIIIIDDPLKPVDALSEANRNHANDWFMNTVISRPDDKRTGAIIIVMQRVHIDDLAGFVLRKIGRLDSLNSSGHRREPRNCKNLRVRRAHPSTRRCFIAGTRTA